MHIHTAPVCIYTLPLYMYMHRYMHTYTSLECMHVPAYVLGQQCIGYIPLWLLSPRLLRYWYLETSGPIFMTLELQSLEPSHYSRDQLNSII